MFKFGIIKESKIPKDNRVLFSPDQVVFLKEKLKDCEFYIESSKDRCFSDDEYASKGLKVVNSLDNCDVIFGIKEVKLDKLIPNKHYFFFGHIAKMQAYNRPLLLDMIKKNITFTDYEYLVDNQNKRICAFGWWAGVVGAYNSIRGYGLKTKEFNIPRPELLGTVNKLINAVKELNVSLPRIIISGTGNVGKGADYFLDKIGVKKVASNYFLEFGKDKDNIYSVLSIKDIVEDIDGEPFDRNKFAKSPENFKSIFNQYAKIAQIYIPCHYWDAKDPKYLTKKNLKDPDLSIKVIGDISCDINGSIEATLRSTTHEDPYYDYNPYTEKEEKAFSSDKNILIMSIDNLPNALPREASEYFGDKFIKKVLLPYIEEGDELTVNKATILKEGKLTEKFSYLKEFAEGV